MSNIIALVALVVVGLAVIALIVALALLWNMWRGSGRGPGGKPSRPRIRFEYDGNPRPRAVGESHPVRKK